MEENEHSVARFLLKIGWYISFISLAAMLILWLISFITTDSTFYFKVNIVTGILIIIFNFFILKDGWQLIGGISRFNSYYIITGILMLINIFFIPTGLIYVAVSVYMKIMEKKEFDNRITAENSEYDIDNESFEE